MSSNSSIERRRRPLARDAGVWVAPPQFDVVVPRDVSAVVVCHGAQSAPEARVDELANIRRLPGHELVVLFVSGVQSQQVIGEIARRLEVVDVDEGVRGGDGFVVGLPGSHHDRYDVVPAQQPNSNNANADSGLCTTRNCVFGVDRPFPGARARARRCAASPALRTFGEHVISR